MPNAETESGFRAELKNLLSETELPTPGIGWKQRDSAWQRLVGQICAIGSSRSWSALERDGVREALLPMSIRRLGPDAESHVHSILVAAGVRYCSPQRSTSAKATAIVGNALSPLVADASGRIVLLERLREEAGEPDTAGLWDAAASGVARAALVRELQFFGPKSASDFLLGLGLSDSQIAFDVRILNLLVDGLGWDSRSRQLVGSLHAYEKLEEAVRLRLADPAGLSLLQLDRIMFQHYPSLRSHWITPDRQNQLDR